MSDYWGGDRRDKIGWWNMHMARPGRRNRDHDKLRKRQL